MESDRGSASDKGSPLDRPPGIFRRQANGFVADQVCVTVLSFVLSPEMVSHQLEWTFSNHKHIISFFF